MNLQVWCESRVETGKCLYSRQIYIHEFEYRKCKLCQSHRRFIRACQKCNSGLTENESFCSVPDCSQELARSICDFLRYFSFPFCLSNYVTTLIRSLFIFNYIGAFGWLLIQLRLTRFMRLTKWIESSVDTIGTTTSCFCRTTASLSCCCGANLQTAHLLNVKVRRSQ